MKATTRGIGAFVVGQGATQKHRRLRKTGHALVLAAIALAATHAVGAAIPCGDEAALIFGRDGMNPTVSGQQYAGELGSSAHAKSFASPRKRAGSRN